MSDQKSTAPAPTSDATSTARPPRGSSGAFFATWIAVFAAIGFIGGAVLASLTQGPSTVSSERSLLWLSVFFGVIGALVGGVVAVVIDAARSRRR